MMSDISSLKAMAFTLFVLMSCAGDRVPTAAASSAPLLHSKSREVAEFTECIITTDGDDVTVKRCLGGSQRDNGVRAFLDPFLVFDVYSGGRHSERWAKGFPAHPHAGFDEVRYVLPTSSWSLSHKDTCGNQGTVGPGQLHLLRTGEGIAHEERLVPLQTPAAGEGFLGFQLWVNTPAKRKSEAPGYHVVSVPSSQTGTFGVSGRSKVTILSDNTSVVPGWVAGRGSLSSLPQGQHHNGPSPLGPWFADPPLLWYHVTYLAPGDEFHVSLRGERSDWTRSHALLYMLEDGAGTVAADGSAMATSRSGGIVQVGPDRESRVHPGEFAALGEGDHVVVASIGTVGANFMLLVAPRLGEAAVVGHGFVTKTSSELQERVRRFRAHGMGCGNGRSRHDEM